MSDYHFTTSEDPSKKYWYLIPHVGRPYVLAAKLSYEDVLKFAKSRLSDGIASSFRIMRMMALLVKAKSSGIADAYKTTLLDLDGTRPLIFHGPKDGETSPVRIAGMFWTRAGELAGNVGIINRSTGETRTLTVGADGKNPDGKLILSWSD